jgi:GTPase Era involved in 16S rRNA processing
MSILDEFINEYKLKYLKKIKYEDNLLGSIQKVRHELLDDTFLPSSQLKYMINKEIEKSKYPMKIAIVGQFSSGKSTFLNAILKKDILPTGITPVTSKINFISYAKEYKIKITYKSGVIQYCGIENLATLTDQRKSTAKDIKYLTLYAVDILKYISFVDTPGLNSQNQSDTQATKDILKDVGGIIWLSLIDSAGKISETEVLEQYIKEFRDKSLCILNQKDKFSQEQIDTTVEYIQDKFNMYFSKIIPISAKMALDSRDEKDNTKAIKLLKNSNIDEVLHFIEENIQPRTNLIKEFTAKKNLKNICDILINEYNSILNIYSSLIKILQNNQNSILNIFDEIQSIHTQELINIYNQIDDVTNTISNEIYANIQTTKATRYEKKKSFLNKENYKKISYDKFWINSDNINKNLFYDDQNIDKVFKKIIKKLGETELNIEKSYKEVHTVFKYSIEQWQESYEALKPSQDIASDLEFSYARHFVAKIYENILVYFNRAILENITSIKKDFAYFNCFVGHNYIYQTQMTITYFEKQIDENIELYENEPTKFTLNRPRADDINKRLKENFKFQEIEIFLISKNNFLSKIIQYSKQQYLNVNEHRVNFINLQENKVIKKIKLLKQIQKDI